MATLYCRPSDIKTDTATITLTVGTADSAYPLTNLYDRLAHTVFKGTAGSATIHIVFAGSTTLQGIAFINHKLAGATVTVTNAAGFSRVVAIPATPQDGYPLDPFDDWRYLANTASTTWDIAITGAATVVAIGELLLIQTLRTITVAAKTVEDIETHRTRLLTTDYGVRLKGSFGVRQRVYRVRVFRDSYRNDVLALQRDAKGAYKNFVFILDSTANDALYVDLTEDTRSIERDGTIVISAELILTQQQNGLAL